MNFKNIVFLITILINHHSFAQNCTINQSYAITPTSSLISNELIRDINCSIVNPAYIEQTCFNSVERILARSVNMNYLINSIWDNPWDGDISNPASNNSSYSNNIKLLVDSKATFVLNAVSKWGGEDHMDINRINPSESGNKSYIQAVRQFVYDINKSFDCANLIRPYIQGLILEHISADQYNGKYLINYVKIPECVIEKFMYDSGFDTQYYCEDINNDGMADIPLKPKSNLYFNRDRIAYKFDINNNPVNSNHFYYLWPDLTNVETKLWYFNCAKIYIDAGINALSLGQIAQVSIKERNLEYPTLINLVSKIREYASTKGIQILLNAEPFLSEDSQGSKYYKTINGIKYFIFDWQGIPTWSSELTNNGFIDSPCQSPIDEDAIFASQECLTVNTPALPNIDCIISKFNLNNESGYGPNGCYYKSIPLSLYFDFGHGCTFQDDNGNGVRDSNEILYDNIPNSNFGHVWGDDDQTWFMKLPPECKTKWFSNLFCKLKQKNENPINVQIPARLLSKSYCGTNPIYNLYSDTTFWNSLLSKLTPTKLDFSIQESCQENTCEYCKILIINGKKTWFTRKTSIVTLKSNSDCTSLYTFHIKKPDGSWFDYVKGTETTLAFNEDGVYEIILRQDNLGLSPSNPNTFGSEELKKYITIGNKESDCFCSLPTSKCSIPKDPKLDLELFTNCIDRNLYLIQLSQIDTGYTFDSGFGEILNLPNYNESTKSYNFIYHSQTFNSSNKPLLDLKLKKQNFSIEIENELNLCPNFYSSESTNNLTSPSSGYFDVHPNPTRGKSTLSLFASQNKQFEITIGNLTTLQINKTISSENVTKGQNNFDLEFEFPGVYFIEFRDINGNRNYLKVLNY
jgi:hypothetical protein